MSGWGRAVTKKTLTLAALLAGLCTLAGAPAAKSAAKSAAAVPPAGKSAAAVPAGTTAASGYRPACPAARPGQVSCFALYAPQPAVNKALAAGAPAAPGGWGARDLESAYRLPVGANPHQTVAVVEAYDTPDLAAYLAVYRKQYRLPPCTASDHCFRKVNEYGKASPLPQNAVTNNSGWDVETMLDVDMVSAACPLCRILVVEANSPSFSDMATAVNSAVRLGANAVSNSYGARELGMEMPYARAYDHPGRAIVVSSGDNGFTAAQYPANLATVTAAGGTQLSRARNKRGWAEQVWYTAQDAEGNGGASSSGCSAYVVKPPWQHDPDCPGRTIADVSAVAWDVAVYDLYQGGWLLVGGTSASSPLIAGVYALAGNARNIKPGYEYAHSGALYDVTVGNNDWMNGTGGATCGYDYMCVAKKGYNAPTGLGTPDGTGAF
jgi:subtilase family serine protease